jgi:hypothetical protein
MLLYVNVVIKTIHYLQVRVSTFIKSRVDLVATVLNTSHHQELTCIYNKQTKSHFFTAN